MQSLNQKGQSPQNVPNLIHTTGASFAVLDWYLGPIYSDLHFTGIQGRQFLSSECKLTNQDFKPGLSDNRSCKSYWVALNIDHFSMYFRLTWKIFHFNLYKKGTLTFSVCAIFKVRLETPNLPLPN